MRQNQDSRPEPTPEQQLERARDWKHIGIALAAGAGALEAMILAEIAARPSK